MKSFLLLLFTIGTIAWSYGQQDGFSVLPDTIPEVEQTGPLVKEKRGSIFSGRPGKSALYSLIIPGAGQIYNKSYFRVPFVYAALGGVGYLMISNSQKYKCYRDAYIAPDPEGRSFYPAVSAGPVQQTAANRHYRRRPGLGGQ